MTVTIGVDPHEATHTAVAISGGQEELEREKVPANGAPVDRLVAWAEPFETRTWAIESAGGLGFLLARQLVAAGETVVDVPPTLAARARLLATGRSSTNDPNDAPSVALAALRSRTLRRVEPVGHGSCSACWRSGTPTSAASGPGSCAACMRCWPSSLPGGSPRGSTLPTSTASSRRSPR